MYNQMFQTTSLQEKQEKLKRVLKVKASTLPNADINKIIDFLDFQKQYFIKVTSRIEKFKNIVINEEVKTSEKAFNSISTPIFGDFTSGLFKNNYGIIEKHPTKMDPFKSAAALKEIRNNKGGFVDFSYILVIYTPNK